MVKGPFDLEERLLNYAVLIVRVTEQLIPSRAGNHVAKQLLRAGTSPLSNHGEAQAAESGSDFVHKLRVCLKELREAKRWLQLIRLVPLTKSIKLAVTALSETEELIRIFVTSIRTADRRRQEAQ